MATSADKVPIHSGNEQRRKEDIGLPGPCRLTPTNFLWFAATFFFWFFFGFITSLHSVVLYCWRKRTVQSECNDCDKVYTDIPE